MTYLSDITCVITSCNRINLLRQTITSLRKYYEFNHWIIIEDGGCDLAEFQADNVSIIYNQPKMGQIRSIDKAYSMVTTPYIFHCEDDWMFFKGGFMEDSMAILKTYPSVLQVHLRKKTDMNGHPVIQLKHNRFDLVDINYKWRGFSFNPGLRRTSDYTSYTKMVGIPSKTSNPRDEQRIGEEYYNRGFITVILKEAAVKHIGNHQSTHR